MTTLRVLVLGAGFGGLELTATLSERLGPDAEITVIDREDRFILGFAKLDVLFGERTIAQVGHPYTGLNRPGVRFVRTIIRAIDPVARRVETDAGRFEADVLVVALGAALRPDATPGLTADGYDIYSPAGVVAARDALAGFTGGRIVVGVAAPVFKCPPAPSEAILRLHEYLSSRGLRERCQLALAMPLPTPIPPVPAASDALVAAFAERDIRWHPGRRLVRLDAARHEAVFADGGPMPYDLFLAVPTHVAPPVTVESGLTDDGWIQVDPRTLRTRFDGVYAIGDVASVGTPKAGVFAEGQGRAVAEAIAASVRGSTAPAYTGDGICHVEMGPGVVARIGVSVTGGRPPVGRFDQPSTAFGAERDAYRVSRLHRWLGIR